MVNKKDIVCDIVINETQTENSNLQNKLASGVYVKYSNISIFANSYEIVSNQNNVMSIFFYSDETMIATIDTEYSICFVDNQDEFGRRFMEVYEFE